MDNAIVVTPYEIFAAVLAICGAIVTVSAAMAVVSKVIEKMKAPEKSQNERIDTLEEDVKSIKARLQLGNQRFEKDTERVESLEQSVNKSNKIILESLQVLIEHSLDDNNKDGLKDMKHKLDSYLLDRLDA
jgi:uncharacterized Ntn-hydrolase superfamily protein